MEKQQQINYVYASYLTSTDEDIYVLVNISDILASVEGVAKRNVAGSTGQDESNPQPNPPEYYSMIVMAIPRTSKCMEFSSPITKDMLFSLGPVQSVFTARLGESGEYINTEYTNTPIRHRIKKREK